MLAYRELICPVCFQPLLNLCSSLMASQLQYDWPQSGTNATRGVGDVETSVTIVISIGCHMVMPGMPLWIQSCRGCESCHLRFLRLKRRSNPIFVDDIWNGVRSACMMVRRSMNMIYDYKTFPILVFKEGCTAATAVAAVTRRCSSVMYWTRYYYRLAGLQSVLQLCQKRQLQ